MSRTSMLLLLLLIVAVYTHFIVADDAADARLLEAAMNNRVNDVQKALEELGANLNTQDAASGQTPLMAAVLRGHVETVELLLNKGADVTIGEKDGYTPAHGAGFQGRGQIMKLLHQHGVDVIGNVHTDGYLPLHRACWGREQRHTDTVKLLLQLGASHDLKGNGRTCKEMTSNPATLVLLEKYEKDKTDPDL